MYNAKKAADIIAAVRDGLEPDRAAQAYGITPEEHEQWIADGRAALAAKRKPTATQAKRIKHVRDIDAALALAELDALRRVR